MIIYSAGRQLTKVHFINILSLVCAAVSIWYGIDLLQTYGLRPADGGVLAPLSVRLAWGGGVMLLGTGFAFGMWLYSRSYVARLEYDQATRRFTAQHIWFLGSRAFDFTAEQIEGVHYHRGRMRGRITVNAPWWSIRVSGRKKPLILDAQGEILEAGVLQQLLRRR